MKGKAVSKVAVVSELSKAADIPVVQASFIYDLIMDIWIKKIKAGKDVILPNIGTLRQIKGREMRSNLTGQMVPPHQRLHFTTNIALERFIRINTRAYPIK